MRTRRTTAMRLGLILTVLCGRVGLAPAQQILLDEPVRAGELILFPDLNERSVFYYVPDKARLAEDENGRPRFSFLRYVQNVRTGAGEAEAREGEGGGIVHALVELSVGEDQLREAQRDLQRVRPGARIEGPVVFRSGKFALVSSFTDPDGTLARRVVGLGSAPLLDGEKAAVSLHLTKEGAKILWESFATPTPDVSFTFEMEIAGYRSPREALIEAHFDQIYEHRSFQAGIASTYLAAEIKAAFDDLRREGAIKLTQVGEDEKLEGLVTTAYNKISDMMFSPLQGTGTPSLDMLGASTGRSTGILDRATALLKEGRERADRENEAIRSRNEEARERNEEARKAQAEAAEARYRASRLERDAEASRARADSLEQRAETAAERVRLLEEMASGSEGDESTELVRTGLEASRTQLETLRGQAQEARAEADRLAQEAGTARQEAERSAAAAPEIEAPEEEVAEPAFAIVASYEMKRVRHRGTFRIDLNKYTADSMTLRFDENVGDLRRLRGDERYFRQVNLDDPLYRQREIVAFVDGVNAEDFGSFVNFVTVQMRKRHAGGEETYDEVRIDRNNFTREGNQFKLLYGWKGDGDADDWLEYEYQATWSFFGGATVEEPWTKTRAGAINLAPPYQRRVIELDADPDTIADAEVRSITVKLFYSMAEREQVKQVTLNAGREQLSERTEILLPAGEEDFQYEIVWRLRGNRTLSSERQAASTSLLFVDELPATAGGGR